MVHARDYGKAICAARDKGDTLSDKVGEESKCTTTARRVSARPKSPKVRKAFGFEYHRTGRMDEKPGWRGPDERPYFTQVPLRCLPTKLASPDDIREKHESNI